MEKEKRYTVAEFATSGWSAVDEKSVHLTREQAQKRVEELIEEVISIAPFGPDERKAFRCRVYLGAFDLQKAEEVANELIGLSDKNSVFLGLMFRSYIEAKTKRLSAAKDTYKQILNQYNLTSNEAVSQFRKYTGEDTYYDSVMFNTFYSLAPQ